MIFLVSQVWPGLMLAFGLGACLGLLIRRSTAEIALKKDLPDLSAYIRRDQADGSPSSDSFARWSDLPYDAQYVSETDVTRVGPRADPPDPASLARKSDLEALSSLLTFGTEGERSTEEPEEADGLATSAGPSQGLTAPMVQHVERQLVDRLEGHAREIAWLRERLDEERTARAAAVARLEVRLATSSSRRKGVTRHLAMASDEPSAREGNWQPPKVDPRLGSRSQG